jgi:hypothetical protein
LTLANPIQEKFSIIIDQSKIWNLTACVRTCQGVSATWPIETGKRTVNKFVRIADGFFPGLKCAGTKMISFVLPHSTGL